jgi:UDP-glucose 4-epimerase
MFKGKILLITGGTGSFGKAVLKSVLTKGWKEIRIFSRDEKKQEELRLMLSCDFVKFIIGDIRDEQALLSATKDVDYIFHAAALKQVPSCEFYPLEAMKTNIIGAGNVLRAAAANNVSRCIVLSTDKAVYPINAMGLSKAMMEKVMIAESRNFIADGSIFCGTRYGNVMGSRGSVIPVFLEKIKNNEPLTITDSTMTRFLMSLPESVDLVLYAFKNGLPGDIFVQKSPATSIDIIANALMEIMGKEVPIKIIGARHGEKKHETLVSREEMARATDCGSYFTISADNRDLNYTKYTQSGDISRNILEDYTSESTRRLNIGETIELLTSTPDIADMVSAFKTTE